MTNLPIFAERIILRLIESSDMYSIHELHSFPETDEFNTLGIPKSIEETNSIIKSWIAAHNIDKIKNYTFAIESKSDALFIGLFGLKLSEEKYKSAEVWFKIHPSFWNQGYGTEALNSVIDYGFKTLKLHRIEAGCAVNNIGSVKVMEKAGMTREGRRRQILPLKTGWSDNFSFSILESDERNT